MHIPQYMKDTLRSAYKHYRLGIEKMAAFEDWLEAHGIDPEDLRVADGNGLEEIEYGNDVVEAVCSRIEQDY